jgi:hypothetical protein
MKDCVDKTCRLAVAEPLAEIKTQPGKRITPNHFFGLEFRYYAFEGRYVYSPDFGFDGMLSGDGSRYLFFFDTSSR